MDIQTRGCPQPGEQQPQLRVIALYVGFVIFVKQQAVDTY